MCKEDIIGDSTDEGPIPEVEAMTVFYDQETGEFVRIEYSDVFANEGYLLKSDIFKDCAAHFEVEREDNFKKWFEICKKRNENPVTTLGSQRVFAEKKTINDPDPNSNGKGV